MGSVTFAMTPEDELEVEEAFFRTLALPSGLTLKGGRFFSGFGYLNEFHAHAWDFVDQPLVYQAFFGGQRAQDGVQLKWLAPTDLFLELGAESGNGDAFPGTRRDANGLNGMTLFAHVGSDIGESVSWRAGALVARPARRAIGLTRTSTRSAIRSRTRLPATSETWIADATLKWTRPGRHPAPLTQAAGRVHAAAPRTVSSRSTYHGRRAWRPSTAAEQDGWYVQGVYQFRPRWRVGARYDALDSGSPASGW